MLNKHTHYSFLSLAYFHGYLDETETFETSALRYHGNSSQKFKQLQSFIQIGVPTF